MEYLTTEVYLDPRGKGTIPSGPNCVCRGESGANFDPELFVSGPQPVARCVARALLQRPNYILLTCILYNCRTAVLNPTLVVPDRTGPNDEGL